MKDREIYKLANTNEYNNQKAIKEILTDFINSTNRIIVVVIIRHNSSKIIHPTLRYAL